MDDKAVITTINIERMTPPGIEHVAYSEVGGRYEGNKWLKAGPSRFRATVEFEWIGEQPAEITALIQRMGVNLWT